MCWKSRFCGCLSGCKARGLGARAGGGSGRAAGTDWPGRVRMGMGMGINIRKGLCGAREESIGGRTQA